MNELRTLLEEFWICRDADKEEYYRVRRDVPNFQKFVREQMGWNLVQTRIMTKLEKIPAHAEGYMGIRNLRKSGITVSLRGPHLPGGPGGRKQFLLSELVDP